MASGKLKFLSLRPPFHCDARHMRTRQPCYTTVVTASKEYKNTEDDTARFSAHEILDNRDWRCQLASHVPSPRFRWLEKLNGTDGQQIRATISTWREDEERERERERFWKGRTRLSGGATVDNATCVVSNEAVTDVAFTRLNCINRSREK